MHEKVTTWRSLCEWVQIKPNISLIVHNYILKCQVQLTAPHAHILWKGHHIAEIQHIMDKHESHTR